ncbi:MAG: DUF2202 domain-containing protein [Arenicellales bacterium]|jgi:hypothetical protein
MKRLNRLIVAGLSALSITMVANPALAEKNNKIVVSDSTVESTLDYNEQTHLEFMCQEEKLARDVYITLGMRYPEAIVFGNIVESEQRHTEAATDMFVKYGFPDPSTNNNVGVFTSETYGEYFTDTYNYLITEGANSELDAFYVGALIEELDMHDILFCPEEIIALNDDINDASDCGKVYTDKEDIITLYGNLLEASENHLRAYVKNIETVIGEGNYEAQYLPQEQVDAILGR